MHVYFVRHGSTILSDAHIHQSPNTPLSEKGKEEAYTVAESLRAVSPDLLVTSEYTRAIETARVIGASTNLTPVTNGLFYEIERPSHLFSTRVFHPRTLWYLMQSFLHRNNPTWRYYDAENFSDIKNRAQKAVAYLESCAQKHTSVVVVSHSIFLHILITYLCENRMLEFWDTVKLLYKSERMKNGAIIHVVFHGRQTVTTCPWELIE